MRYTPILHSKTLQEDKVFLANAHAYLRPMHARWARIILLSMECFSAEDIAAKVNCCPNLVHMLRSKWLLLGRNLIKDHIPVREIVVTSRKERAMINKACNSTSRIVARWANVLTCALNGMTKEEIAVQFHCLKCTVTSILERWKYDHEMLQKRAGKEMTPLRKKALMAARKLRDKREARRANIVLLYSQCVSQSDIARKYRCSRQNINGIVMKWREKQKK